MSGTEPARGRGPARRVLEDEQRQLLVDVAEARRAAEAAYLDAIMSVHDAGGTLAAIAEAVGVSAESIRQTVNRRKA